MREHHIQIPRTGRFYVAGDPGPGTREIWYVCHGYGQLARLFLRHFEPLATGERVVVAPEALSRFYLEDPQGGHANARVGATWMTREDRLADIADYVGYLDAVAEMVQSGVSAAVERLVVLGFSQGAATACRWVARGRVRPVELVLWGERLPHDFDVAADAAALRRLRVTFVAGSEDRQVTPDAIAEHRSVLGEHGVLHRLMTFQGGHRLHAEALRLLAASISS
jgi:predicted esterase